MKNLMATSLLLLVKNRLARSFKIPHKLLLKLLLLLLRLLLPNSPPPPPPPPPLPHPIADSKEHKIMILERLGRLRLAKGTATNSEQVIATR